MIFITLGDPYSVNIECLSYLLSQLELANSIKLKSQTVLIGSYKTWLNQGGFAIQETSSLHPKDKNGLYFFDLDNAIPHNHQLSPAYRGAVSRAALEALKTIELTKQDAILSCPVDKKETFSKDSSPGGQTEFFQKLSGRTALMTMVSPKFSVGLATNHLALKDVPGSLDKALISSKLSLFCKFLGARHKRPRIAVCALNPHCGDNGLFGNEDINIVTPAVKELLVKKEGTKNCEIFGPLAADTVFWQARKGFYNGVFALYHDQGLAPIKALAFEETVNVSVGLGFLRVSPAHGPAADLFKQNKADPSGFKQAFKLITEYLNI